jgi:hypothetical protein
MNAKISALAEWFSLNRAEKTARGYSAGQLASIKQLAQAAAARVVLADQTTDAVFAPAAVTLHREAIRLLGNALLIASGQLPPAGPPLGLPEVLLELEAAVARGQLPPPPARYAEARAILDTPEHLTFAGRDDIERARGRSDVELVTAWLNANLQFRSVREVWLARAARLAMGVAGLAVVVRIIVALAMRRPIHG